MSADGTVEIRTKLDNSDVKEDVKDGVRGKGWAVRNCKCRKDCCKDSCRICRRSHRCYGWSCGHGHQ